MLLLSMLDEHIKNGKIVKVYLIHFRLERLLAFGEILQILLSNTNNTFMSVFPSQGASKSSAR